MPEPWTTSASASIGRRRHRDARRGLGVLHLEPLRRDRSRPTRRACSSATRASSPSCGCTLNGIAARAARRDRARSVQRRVRAARPSVEGPRRLAPRAVPAPLRRPRHARRPRDRELRRGSRVLLDRAAGRRRLRRPVRGQGRPRPQAGPARRRERRARALTFTLQAPLVRARDPRRLQRRRRASTATTCVYETVVPPRGQLVGVHRGDAGDRRPRGHAALPVRPAGRALDARRAARGVAGAHARSSRATTTSSARCSIARRATSPGCASSTPSSPTARSSPRARRGS